VLGYLDDQQPGALCQAAIRVLGWLAAPQAVMPLLARVTDETLQDDALTALLRIARSAPAAVLDTWQQGSPLQRAYLAYVFGEAGCVDSVPVLREALAAADARQAQMAAHALGRLGGLADLAPLAACLRHDDADVRDAAVQALCTLGVRFPQEVLDAVDSVLGDADATCRGAAVCVLGRLDAELVAAKLTMALKDPAIEVRRAALRALGGASAARHLLAIQLALSDEDVEVRRTAAEILGTCGDRDALDGLRLALADDNLWVRTTAIRSLGELGGAEEAPVIAGLLDDPVGMVQIAALETLVRLLGEQASPHLGAALDRGDDEVVNVALDLLERHGSFAWLAAHAEALINHPARNVRSHCARLLAGRIGDALRPALQRRLQRETDAAARQQFEAVLQGLDH
jgi:HEAT repeat protein